MFSSSLDVSDHAIVDVDVLWMRRRGEESVEVVKRSDRLLLIQTVGVKVKNPEDELVIQSGVLVEPPCLRGCTVLMFNDPFHGFHHMESEDH